MIYINAYDTNIFSLASYYIKYISLNHPFVDGNKRTALASAVVFLEFNGYSIDETYEEELADLVLNFINKKIQQKDLVQFLRGNSRKN